MLQQEIELTRALAHELQHGLEQLLVQLIRDLQHDLELLLALTIREQREAIQHHALIQPPDQIDPRHDQARLQPQGQGQDQPQEVVAVEALHEEEIIRHK